MIRPMQTSLHRWVGATALVVAGVVAVGCAPEKPSDRTATELEVEIDETGALEDGEAVVARVDGEEITRDEFNRRIDGLVEFARARLQSTERRRDFLRAIVEFEVMADEAERRQLGDHPRVRQAMKKTMVELMLDERVSDEVSMADIDEEARRAYFDAHTDEFHRDERRRIARIVVADVDRVQKLVADIEEDEPEDLEEAEEVFRRSAYYYSEDRETGDRGGVVGWYEGDDGGMFGEDIFQWEPGTVQGPFEREGEVVLKMVIDVDEARRPAFDELEQQLTTAVYEERRRQARSRLVDEMTAGADVEIFADRLDDIERPRVDVPPPLEELPRGSTDGDEDETQ